MWLEFILLAVVATVLFYRWATKNNDFFKKLNLPYDKPTFLLGSGTDSLVHKKSFLDIVCELYNAENDIVYGTFEGRQPVYLIRDPQLVKQIMIKDFDHFVNRNNFVDAESDDLLGNSLLLMTNEKWRNMRSTLSPAFTGSKMRQMFKLIVLEIQESINYLKTQIKDLDEHTNGLEMDVKDFTSRLNVGIIASTAFGIKVNSFQNRDNEFYIKAQKAINFTTLQQIKMVIVQLFPKVAKILKLSIFDKDFSNYFMRLVLDAMKYRMENNIHRPDMINLLMEARGMWPTDVQKAHYQEWSDVEMVAQCFIFFFAGMEPSSALLSFSIHELMENPDIQDELFNEIQEYNEYLENDGELSYENLQKMSYMHKVVSEILRKWPVTLVTDRLCTNDFVYETTNGKRLEIKKGEMVRIPMVALHRDPQYYPQPDVLNPERFSDENISNIETGTYLPFGLGPRNCIANRFTIMQTKAFLFHILREYRLEASPKTMRPMKLKKTAFQLIPEKGFWIQFVPRK